MYRKHQDSMQSSATSGGSKHKTLALNCITVHIRVQKLIFEQHPSSQIMKDGNKLVEDRDKTIIPITPRAVGNSMSQPQFSLCLPLHDHHIIMYKKLEMGIVETLAPNEI